MSDRYLDLAEQIEQTEEFQQRWVYEVRAYYQWEEKDGFDDSPSSRLRERSEEVIRAGIRQLEQNERYAMGDASPAEIHELLLAIGMELLLNAILLQRDWEKFIDLSDTESGETPTLDQCESWIMGNLPDELGDEERKRVYNVIRLLKIKRNNIVHFGYYRFSHANQRKEVYRVLAFLFAEYFEADQIMRKLLQKFREFQERKVQAQLDYPSVDFGFDHDDAGIS